MKNEVGVVVIGRNEGDRLKRCLSGVRTQSQNIVYVDSGSIDGSLKYAKSIGIGIVNLDMSIPFSAGRARNEGFAWLIKHLPHLEYIQFIDGDCELDQHWIEIAVNFLRGNTSCAIVAGNRKEKKPNRSIYNLLCDIEWNPSIGKVEACGGDFMIRKLAFQEVNGFNPSVVAGEEPDLCYRLALKGWDIFRIDHLMTMHDAAITHFSQWFKRTMRTGHFYAQGYALHRKDGQGYCWSQTAKSWFWALLFPAFTLLLSALIGPICLLLFLVYLLQIMRVAAKVNRRLKNVRHSIAYGVFTVLAKWPQLIGQLVYIWRSLLKKKYSIIEYQ